MTFRFGAFQTLLRGFVILSFADFLICTTPDKVSLSWRRHGDHLCFSCDVKNLSLGVSFQDPHGNTRGHCTAPIPHTVAGHCDSHLKQNIFNETTELIVDRVDCENGLWKCFHGENTNEYATASVSVSVDSMEQKPKASQVHTADSIYQGCTLLPLMFGFFIALVFLSLLRSTFVNDQNETGIQFVKTFCKKTMLTKPTCWLFLPFGLIFALPLVFAGITEICGEYWWILGILVGVVPTAFVYGILVWRERSKAKSERARPKAPNLNAKLIGRNEDGAE